MSKVRRKSAPKLTLSDLELSPIWQFTNDDERDETIVEPVIAKPATHLRGRLVGARVRLANGDSRWAILGNVDLEHPELAEHFLSISIESGGRWFQLARYHDPDHKTHGPAALSRFLGLEASEIFPISYDLRGLVQSSVEPKGLITLEPEVRLTRSQLVALAIPRTRK